LVRDSRYTEFCKGLTKAGYRYAAQVVNAASFGVPQRRERLVLVAMLGREVPADWLTPKAGLHATVRDAIGALPKAGQSGDALHDYPENRSEKMLARIRITPRDGGSRKDLPTDEQCRCHSETTGFHDVYGRMAWSNVAPTITSGCTNPSKGRFLHPHEHRAITLREAALLQTFPPDYQFDLSRGKEHAAAQIGNAFPPLLIRPIAKKLAEALRR
jgi:DNA (cytosine-5)-methyltransferase 1